MIITQHGNSKEPFYKGVSMKAGKRLVFFGWTAGQVRRREQEWLFENAPVGVVRERARPALTLIQGGRKTNQKKG